MTSDPIFSNTVTFTHGDGTDVTSFCGARSAPQAGPLKEDAVPRLGRSTLRRMDAAVQPVDVIRVASGVREPARDVAAAEEPLEIRLGGSQFVVIMRTPGGDRELTAGFLLSERIIRAAADIASIRHCTQDEAREYQNIINVWLTGDAAERATTLLTNRRPIVATSACGVCGRRSIDDLLRDLPTSR